MRSVIIRFAGEPDAVVRRKARQLGGVTPSGQKKVQVFRGYILSATGGPDRSIVTVIELPSKLRTVRNFISNMDYVGLDTARSISRTALRKPKWVPPKPGVTRAKPRKKITSVFFSCSRLSTPDRLRELRADQDDLRTANIVIGRSAGIEDDSQGRLRYEAEVYGQHSVTKLTVFGESWFWLPYTVWRGLLAPINDSVLISIETLGRGRQADSYEVYIESSYLSKLYGSRVRLVGAPNRTNDLTDTGRPYGDPPEAFFYDGKPVALPLIFGNRPGDVNSTSYSAGVRNPWAFKSTLEAFGARPQACHPHAATSGDGVILMFPCVNIPDDFDVMNIEALDSWAVPESRQVGNLSSLSFVLGAGDLLNSIDGTAVMGYGTPLVCLLAVNPKEPLTEAEATLRLANDNGRIPDLIAPPAPYSEGARYPHPVGEVLDPVDNAIGQYLDIPRLIEGEPMPDIGTHLFVSLYDLPEWIWPDKVKDAWAQFITATGADPETEPKMHSDQRMSAVFGEVRSTQIGDEAEFLFSVTSRATTTISVVNKLREYNAFGDPELDEFGGFVYYGPDDAPVHQTKTAIVSVKAQIISEDGRITGLLPSSYDLLHKDVIGPVRSSLYEGSGMDAATAKLPSMIWSGVVQEKRVYLVRAVRYIRDEFCGSLEQRTRSGTIGTIDGSSFFEDNGRYGPKPDQDAFEELWLMVDGVRVIITPPDNRLIAPAIEAQTYYPFADPYSATLGVSTPETDYWLLGIESAADERPTANDRMLAERYGLGAVFNTVARISDTDLMVIAHSPGEEGINNHSIALLRINALTGESRTVFTGDLPDSPTAFASGRFFSLNCYQREVLKNDEVVMPAHLFIRRGAGPAVGGVSYLYASVDGGETWLMTLQDGGGLGQHIETSDMISGAVDPASPLYKGRL